MMHPRHARRAITCVLATAVWLAFGVEGRCTPIRPNITYSTSATIGAERITGTPSIIYQGVENQTIQAAVPFPNTSFPWKLPDGATADFPLGQLLLNLPATGSTSYEGASLNVTVTVTAIDGITLSTPLETRLQGNLTGVINSEGTSNLQALLGGYSLHPPYTPPFPVGGGFGTEGLSHFITFPDYGRFALDSSSSRAITLSSQLISEVHTPEPSTFLIFSAIGLGLVCYRKHGRRSGKNV